MYSDLVYQSHVVRCKCFKWILLFLIYTKWVNFICQRIVKPSSCGKHIQCRYLIVTHSYIFYQTELLSWYWTLVLVHRIAITFVILILIILYRFFKHNYNFFLIGHRNKSNFSVWVLSIIVKVEINIQVFFLQYCCELSARFWMRKRKTRYHCWSGYVWNSTNRLDIYLDPICVIKIETSYRVKRVKLFEFCFILIFFMINTTY